jgi:hypothetical protein
MVWVFGIGIVLLLIIIALLLSRVRVSIMYGHQLGQDNLSIRAEFMKGFFHYSWELPLDSIEKDEEALHVPVKQKKGMRSSDRSSNQNLEIGADTLLRKMDEAKGMVESVFDLGPIVRRFFKKMKVEKMIWESKIGTGDAASTGLFSGLIWTLKSSSIGFLSNITTFSTLPVMEVLPFFQEKIIHTKFVCIFSFRIGQAMLAAFQVAKNWKGRKHHVRTSNPGFDANSDGKY